MTPLPSNLWNRNPGALRRVLDRKGVFVMGTKNGFLTLAIAFAAGFVIALALLRPPGPVTTEKTDRLAGSSVETAFLPERFGVPPRNP